MPAPGLTTGSGNGNLNDGPVSGLLAYFDQHGLWTQWYWPPGRRGRLWRRLHPR